MQFKTAAKVVFICATGVLIGCERQQQAAPESDQAIQTIADEPVIASAGQGVRDGEWLAYGSNIGNTKYTSLDQIDASNVNDLEIAWRRPALDQYFLEMNPNQRYTTTWNSAPIVRNGIA